LSDVAFHDAKEFWGLWDADMHELEGGFRQLRVRPVRFIYISTIYFFFTIGIIEKFVDWLPYFA